MLHAFLYPSVHALRGMDQRNIHPWSSFEMYCDWGSPHDLSKMQERCDQMFLAVFRASSSAGAFEGVVTPNMQFHASLTAQSRYRPHRSCFGNTACARGGGSSSFDVCTNFSQSSEALLVYLPMVILHCMPPHQSNVFTGGTTANIRANTASSSSGCVRHLVKSMSGRYSRPFATLSLPAPIMPSRACCMEHASGKAMPESVNLLCFGPSLTGGSPPDGLSDGIDGSHEDFLGAGAGSAAGAWSAAGAGDDASSAALSAFSAGEDGSGPIDNGAAPAAEADGVARGSSSSRWSVSLCPYPLTCMNVGTTKRIAKMIIVIEIARRLCGSTGRRVPNGFAEVASGVGAPSRPSAPSRPPARPSPRPRSSRRHLLDGR